MSTTLTYGFKRPDTNDKGSSWFSDLEDNITRLDAHDHDGTDSAQLTNSGIAAAAAIAVNKLAALTASKAVTLDGSGFLQAATATAADVERLPTLFTTADSLTIAEISTPATPSSGFGEIYFKSDGSLYQLNDAGVETKVGEGGSSGINYILNATANSDTTGWAAYADAAAATPADGTAGSPTVTITRTTTTPLREDGSFLLTKDAADRQGEGVSYDFTIDRADRAKVLNVSFDYEIASGTFASGDSSDVRVFIYDVTNTSLIPVTPATIQGGGSSQHKFSGTFQTASDSESYRLILHCATTSASAYTFEFDNVNVGPQVVALGSPIGEWISFTPTGTLTSNTTYTGAWRRVGDSMEVVSSVSFSSGTNAADVDFNLPTGYTIDSAKLANSTITENHVGMAHMVDSGTLDYAGVVLPVDTSSVQVKFMQENGTAANELRMTSTNLFTIASGDSIDVRYMVPISGWGSSVEMSNDTDTRVVAALYETNTGTSITNAAATTGDFACEDIKFDTHAAYNTSTAIYTVPVSGKYSVSAHCQLSANAGWAQNEELFLELYKNGSSVRQMGGVKIQTTFSQQTQAGGTALVDVTAGDTLEVRIFQNSGGAITLNGDASENWTSFHRLSGPATIAASESVNARYHVSGSTTNGTLSGAGAQETIDFDTKLYDSHNAVTTGASWVFTVPVAGKYQVSCSMGTSASTANAANDRFDLKLYLNGSDNATLGLFRYQNTSASLTAFASGTASVECSVGDTLAISAFQDTGTNTTYNTSATNNFVCIERIGN